MRYSLDGLLWYLESVLTVCSSIPGIAAQVQVRSYNNMPVAFHECLPTYLYLGIVTPNTNLDLGPSAYQAQQVSIYLPTSDSI